MSVSAVRDSENKMEYIMSLDDLAIKLLSPLSPRHLAVSKCVSKRWYAVITSYEFLRSHRKELAAFYFQHPQRLNIEQFYVPNVYARDLDEVDYLSLKFLPEKVTILSSFNGLLCCRSWVLGSDGRDQLQATEGQQCQTRKRSHNGLLKGCSSSPKVVKVYVCNPVTKKFITLKAPRYYDVSFPIALTYSITSTTRCLMLVSVRRLGTKDKPYTFSIYTSGIGRWRSCSKEAYCYSEYTPLNDRHSVVGSKCYWLMSGHHILSFDIEKERSTTINLPGPKVPYCQFTLGDIEGYLHYCCADNNLCVWKLEDNERGTWVLKHSICMLGVYESHRHFKTEAAKRLSNKSASLIGLIGEQVFLHIYLNIYSLNLSTKVLKQEVSSWLLNTFMRMEPTLLPYTESLASIEFFCNKSVPL